MKILELFAGSRSIGRNAESLGYKVFSVDWVPYEGINLSKDIENLRKSDIPFVPDMIWASPDCKTYSVLAVRHHRNGIIPKTAYAKKCDAVNTHFISLIKKYLKINPKMVFFIENPRGMLRKMPFMQSFKRHTVWYCQYGHQCAKPTDIWTNCTTWVPRPPCHNGNTKCHHLRVPRGTSGGIQGMKNSYERSKIPDALCIEVIKAAAQKPKVRKLKFVDSNKCAPLFGLAA
jgi:hypothetical protein